MSAVTRKATCLVCAMLLAVLQSGCGTIFGGSSQEVSIGSSPEGARVEFDHASRTVATPAEVELKRGNAYELTFTKEGYEEETATIESSLRAEILILDVLFTGLIGVAIDAGTGAWNSLSPETVRVALDKTDPETAGPETLEVQIGPAGGGTGDLQVSADEPVVVEIRTLP